MTWLTRIRIDYSHCARLGLKDNYAWHQALWEIFPGLDGEQRPFLFRVNAGDYGSEVLLLSSVEPTRPQWCPDDSWATKAINPEFFRHRYYRFDLKANATRKVTKLGPNGGPVKNGRRTVLSSERDLRDWIERKAKQGGFRILDKPTLVIDPRTDYRFRKENTSGLHVGVCFRGGLEVTESTQFVETFHLGIGSAKAFGFGLLLLQPIRLNLE